MKKLILAFSAMLSVLISQAQVDSVRSNIVSDSVYVLQDTLSIELSPVDIQQVTTGTTVVTPVSEKVQSNPSAGEVYKLKPWVDIPLTVATTAWTLYGFSQIYSKDPSTDAEILALNKEDINSFDRPGATVYSEKAKNTSDLFFYGSMPLPLVLLADKEMRKDAGKIGLLYLEAMGITGLLYTGAAFIHDKYRPLAYNPAVPMETRKRGGAKNSFFAGHVALVGTSTFFTASVFHHYHPNSPLRYVFYSAATAATLATGYLRYKGGQHFKTDVIIGTAVGTLSGLLVPRFHRVNRFLEEKNISFLPSAGDQYGFTMRYSFK